MTRLKLTLALLALSAVATPALARTALDSFETGESSGGGELPPYLQCVPYARQVSGIEIYGDAHTWWDQAAGRFARGSSPRVGAVMAFRPHGNMKLGHVAAVSRVLDSRTVLLRHANWSEIEGRRGQIEDNVRAVDVSPTNDWSEVRVWYAPTQALGTTHWPVEGFIYKDRISRKGATVAAKARDTAGARASAPAPARIVRTERIGGGESPRASTPGGSNLLARVDDPIGAIIAANRKRR